MLKRYDIIVPRFGVAMVPRFGWFGLVGLFIILAPALDRLYGEGSDTMRMIVHEVG